MKSLTRSPKLRNAFRALVALSICAYSNYQIESCSSAAITVYEPYVTLSLIKGCTRVSKLRDHDVVLIIDKSRSMSTVDCPRSAQAGDTESRWEWCEQQTADVSKETQNALPSALKVVLFSNSYTYESSDTNEIQQAFLQNVPSGATNTAAALSSQLDAYFDRKAELGDKTKPVLIALITDGCPESTMAVCHAVEDATQRMDRPDEISITVLQVGHDTHSAKFMDALTKSAASKRSKFGIVTTISFEQLQNKGLMAALVEAVSPKPKVSATGQDQ